MRPVAHALALVSWLAVAAPACYAPDVESGTLRCGPDASCPAGYMCQASDKTCWKDDEKPGTAPLGGAVPPAFEGHWIFNKPASKVSICSDSRDTRDLAKEEDYVDLFVGTTTDLMADYYCAWELNVAPNGKAATLRPGTRTSCMTTSIDQTTKFTWEAVSFTFVKTGASSGVLNAEISSSYVKVLNCTTNCMGTCTVTMSGPLTKID